MKYSLTTCNIMFMLETRLTILCVSTGAYENPQRKYESVGQYCILTVLRGKSCGAYGGVDPSKTERRGC